MPTDLERLRNQRSAWIEHLEVESDKIRDASNANTTVVGKPSYSLNGRSMSWLEYWKGVNEIIAGLTDQIQTLETAESPWEVETTMY